MKEDISQSTATEQELLQEICHHFTHQPVVAEVALQLLASRCMLMHRQLQAVQQQQQQQWQLSPQLGKRMRGDLLLLSDPQPRVAPLLPADAFVRADAEVLQIGSSSSSEASLFSLDGMCEMVLLLHMQLLAFKLHGRSDTKGVASSRLTLSGPALQLTAELLLSAAVHWQQLYHNLTGRQQLLLNLPAAEVPPAESRGIVKLRNNTLASAQTLLAYTAKLLQLQVQQLWNDGQWQPQMQLLQQGGGEVLLQGLTLAVHCAGLDSEMREACLRAGLSLSAMMSMLVECASGEGQHPHCRYFNSHRGSTRCPCQK
jgi:hypothetical protein